MHQHLLDGLNAFCSHELAICHFVGFLLLAAIGGCAHNNNQHNARADARGKPVCLKPGKQDGDRRLGCRAALNGLGGRGRFLRVVTHIMLFL